MAEYRIAPRVKEKVETRYGAAMSGRDAVVADAWDARYAYAVNRPGAVSRVAEGHDHRPDGRPTP